MKKERNLLVLYYTSYPSSLGPISLYANEQALVGLYFIDHKYQSSTLKGQGEKKENHPILKETKLWLDHYFAGKKPSSKSLSLATNPDTKFRRIIWDLLKEIPYGQTCSYGDLAREAGKILGKEKMSAQAVGGAVGHNPISIIIPCHRVVGKNGSLTGYGGGIQRKIQLLKIEGVNMDKFFIPKTSTAP